MKAKLTITDSAGAVFEGEIELAQVGGSRVRASPRTEPARVVTRRKGLSAADFKLPVRAFMKRFAEGRPGHEAFTLLVARLAEGEVGTEVKVEEIQAEWNRVRGLLPGDYAPVYGTRAKGKAWVDNPGRARGVFALGPDWTEVLESDE